MWHMRLGAVFTCRWSVFNCWPRYFFPLRYFVLFFLNHFFYVLACFSSFILPPLYSFTRCCLVTCILACTCDLTCDLNLFCTWHLKLADTHKASVIVCLPELSLDYSFILQKIWEKMLKKRQPFVCLQIPLMHIYRSQGYFAEH